MLCIADLRKCFASHLYNDGHIRDRLDIIDSRWLTPESKVSREGRLETRVSALAFERVHHRRFFSNDIRSGAFMHRKFDLVRHTIAARLEIFQHSLANE